MKRYFFIPIHSTPLVLVVTFAIGLLLAFKAGLTGIPLGFLLFSWFFKYCFVLFDSVAAGEDEPPVLSIEMVNPVSEQRPLVLAALVTAEVMLVWRAGPWLRIAAVVAVAILLPAHIAVLGFTRNVFKAVWPPALFAVITRLGRDYLLIVGVMLLAGLVGDWSAARGDALFIVLVVNQLTLLLLFALVAGALFEHRLELGIDSKTRQERLAERASREHAALRGRMLDMAYSSFRVRKPLDGWREIETWLKAHDDSSSEYQALLEATSAWDDVRAADKLANDYVAILLARRATGEALAVVEQRLASNPRYQVSPQATAIRMAELAGAAGKKGLQRKLMARD